MVNMVDRAFALISALTVHGVPGPDEERLMTSGELAKILGVDRSTLARWVRDGVITPSETTVGGHRRWRLRDVREQLRVLRERADVDE